VHIGRGGADAGHAMRPNIKLDNHQLLVRRMRCGVNDACNIHVSEGNLDVLYGLDLNADVAKLSDQLLRSIVKINGACSADNLILIRVPQN